MSCDFMQKFAFKTLPIKGALVNLTDVWQKICAQKSYSSEIMIVMGELIAANVLLASSIKLDGRIIIQLQDNPNVDLIVSECTNEMKIRATAKNWDPVDYTDYLDSGKLVISIDSNREGKLYQSVVEMSGNDTVSDVLNNYMAQSEQLKTLFILVATEEQVVGFMIQEMPDRGKVFIEEVQRIFMLAKTLTNGELLRCASAEVLHKLFNEDDILLFDPINVEFKCTCGQDRVINMLRGLGFAEVSSIFEEQEEIRITCDFCNSVYVYYEDDLNRLFNDLSFETESISQEVH